MDTKKLIQLRLFFYRSLTEKMHITIQDAISQVFDTTDIVQIPEHTNTFLFIPKEKKESKEYKFLLSKVITNYVRTNYTFFIKLYDQYAYENREFRDCISKDDIQSLLNDNSFLYNMLIYNEQVSVSFG